MKIAIAQKNNLKINWDIPPEKLKLLILLSFQKIITKILVQSNRMFTRVLFKMKEKMGMEKAASLGKRSKKVKKQVHSTKKISKYKLQSRTCMKIPNLKEAGPNSRKYLLTKNKKTDHI